MIPFSILTSILFIIIVIIAIIAKNQNNKEKRIFLQQLSEELNLELHNYKESSGFINDYYVELSLVYERNKRESNYLTYKFWFIFLIFDLFDNTFNRLNDNELKIEIHSKNTDNNKFILNCDSYYKDQFKTGESKFDKNIQMTTSNEKNITARMTKYLRTKIRYSISQSNDFQIYNNRLISKTKIQDINYSINIVNDNLEIMNKIYNPINENEMLINNIKNEKNNNIRIKNMRMLLGINKSFEPRASINNIKKKYSDFFRECFDDPVLEIRAMAAYAMEDEGFPILYGLLKKYSDKTNIVMILNMIKQYWQIKDIRKELYRIFDKNNIYLNKKILKIFIEINDNESIKYVLKHFGKKELLNEDDETRKILINYFTELKVKESIPWFALLYKQDPDLRLNCIYTLEKIGDISAVEYLIPLTKGFKSFEIKKAAKDAIQKLQKNASGNKGDLTLTEMENEGNLSIQNTDVGKLSNSENE